MQEISRFARLSSQPKTVLGFFAIVLGILVAGAASTIWAITGHATLQFLIPWILGIAVAVIVLVLIGVFVTAWKDPTRLMLGRITGKEFAEYQRMTLGDSSGGEYIDAATAPVLMPADDSRVLVAPGGDDTEEEEE